MKIALLAPFEETVPPKKYGGTELVVFNLAEELVKLGHDVTLFASGDSKTSAKLVACVDRAVRVLPAARNLATRRILNLAGLAEAITVIQNSEYDIVHNHYGWQFLLFRHLIKQPFVTTLHGTLNKDIEPTDYYVHTAPMYSRTPFVSISDSQRSHAPKLNYVATVYNGIEVDRFQFNDRPDDYLAFLGRIHPQKGPEYAIKIAKKTGKRLIIAAKIDPVDRPYFNNKIKPLIDNKQITFIGEISHVHKVKLLKNAAALLSPLQWDEPFGLSNVEAMACGTPVITMNRGSLPEIVIDGQTGYLCRNIEQMISRVHDINKIQRSLCRDHVEKLFTARRMAENYLNVYKKIIKQRS